MSELEQCYKALEQIGKSIVQKSASGKPANVQKAMAMTEASKTPAGAVLVRKILQLEQQRSVRAQFGPVLKAMGEDIEDDESEEELIEQLRDVLRQEKSLAKRINRIRARRA